MARGWPVVLVAAIVVLAGTAIFGKAPRHRAPPPPVEAPTTLALTEPEMVAVVVPLQDMHTAESFDAIELTTILVPATLVPPNIITTVSDLIGKVAMGPIGARSFISRAALGNPVATPAGPLRSSDSVLEDLLIALQSRLTQVTVTVKGPPLMRGARVALYPPSPKDSAPVIEEGWVITSEPQATTLLVYPEDAPTLKAFSSTTVWHAAPAGRATVAAEARF